MVGGGSQSLDGAGASPHTSLENEQKLQVDMREELTARDRQLAELRERLDHEELLNKQLQDNVSRLKSDLVNATAVMSSASKFTDTVKALKAELEEKKAKLRTLTEQAITKDDEISSTIEVSRAMFKIVVRYILSSSNFSPRPIPDSISISGLSHH